uniref:Lipoprotein n=1 Tax=Streptomyces sp. NBC_00093 TaxID=2975649 RepID=A0AAU2A2P1_9ACTN
MRTRTTAAAVTTLLAAVLVGCSADSEEPAVAEKDVPAYSVIKDEPRSAELLVANATTDSATAAIEDWIAKNAGDRQVLGVQVVRTTDAGTIVCRAEYYADEATARVQTGGRITADKWPHTAITCPDPAGS